MRKGIKYYSIRLKLMAVYMVLLIIMLNVLILFFAFRFERVYKEQIDSHMADITAVSTANIEGMLDQLEQLSVSVMTDQIVQENLRSINRKVSSDNENSEDITVEKAAISDQVKGRALNIDGIISLCIYPADAREIPVKIADREYMEYSMSPEEIYGAGGAPVWEIAGDQHCLCMGRAILDMEDMHLLGHMVIICTNEYLSDQLARMSGSYSSYSYLVDETGVIIASSAREAAGDRFSDSAEKLKEKNEETLRDSVSGQNSFYYIGDKLENGWTIITTASAEQFRRESLISIFQTVGVTATALIVTFVVTLAAVRRLMAPTERLLKSMSDFGDGQLDARVQVSTSDEVGQISEAYNQMADNIQNLMEKVYLLELANKEAEIEVLKMQINPHFLYNTLDTISWLGYAGKSEKVTEISVSLAKLLRASIKRADMVTVEEEIQTVDYYLVIQSVRFADKFTVEKNIDDHARRCYMPGFLLQPLVENSIIHGLEGQIRKGKLSIAIIRKEEWISFSVSDDGKGMDEEQLRILKKQCAGEAAEKSIGLANVYRRLWLMYGEFCQFELRSAPGKGTSVSFRIPVILEKEKTQKKDQERNTAKTRQPLD